MYVCIQLLYSFRQTPCGVSCFGTPQNICHCVYFQNTSQYHFYKRILLRNSHLILVPRIGFFLYLELILWTLWMLDLTRFLFLPWLLRSLKCVLCPKCQSWWCVLTVSFLIPHPLVSHVTSHFCDSCTLGFLVSCLESYK